MALILPRPPDFDPKSVPETEHSGVILVRNESLSSTRKVGKRTVFDVREGVRGTTITQRRVGGRTVTRTGTALDLDLVSESAWAFNVRADLFLEHIFDALLVHHRANILAGTKADGSGPQPPLTDDYLHGSSKRKKEGAFASKNQGRKSTHRGYKTGFFADTIHRSRITGSTSSASVRMVSHPHRNAFVGSEATRGILYFFVEGHAEKVIAEAVSQVLDASLEGKIKPKPDSGEKPASEAA